MYAFYVNFVGVILAALAAVAIGMIWFSPVVFGGLWKKTIQAEYQHQARSRMDRWLSSIAIVTSSLLSSYVLAVFLKNLFIPTLHEALLVGLFAWLGFIVPVFKLRHILTSRKILSIESLLLVGCSALILLIEVTVLFFVR